MKYEDCIICKDDLNSEAILFENDHAICVPTNDPVLENSYVIVPKAHKETPFDLSAEEWAATKDLLDRVKRYLDEKCCPDGYSLGWNVGKTGGQEVFHAHMHVIPRFKDEPYAGRGIRYWLKQPENKRPV